MTELHLTENGTISYMVGEHSHQICPKLSRVIQTQFVALGQVAPTLVLWSNPQISSNIINIPKWGTLSPNITFLGFNRAIRRRAQEGEGISAGATIQRKIMHSLINQQTLPVNMYIY